MASFDENSAENGNFLYLIAFYINAPNKHAPSNTITLIHTRKHIVTYTAHRFEIGLWLFEFIQLALSYVWKFAVHFFLFRWTNFFRSTARHPSRAQRKT